MRRSHRKGVARTATPRAIALSSEVLPTEDGVLRKRYLRRFVFGWIVLGLLAVPAIIHSHAAIEGLLNQPPDWVPNSLPEKARFNEFTRRFAGADVIMVSWPGAELDSQSLDAATNAIKPLCENHSGVTPQQQIDAAIDAGETLSPTDALVAEIHQAADSRAPFQWARSGTEVVEQIVASSSRVSRRNAIARVSGSLVGPDGKQSCLVVSLARSGVVHRRKIIELLRQLIAVTAEVDESKIAMVGSPVDGATVDDESVRSIQTFSPPAVFFAAILCFICLRSFWLTSVIAIVAVIGQGMVLAAVHYTGTPMNAVLIVLPPLVFVLTVSSGIHLSNYYLDAIHEFADLTPASAARQALKAGTTPCLLATGTTVIGLGSLVMVRLEPIRIFGLVASLGVMSTLLMLLLMLPGAMMFTKPRNKADEGSDDLADDNGASRFDKNRVHKVGPVRSYMQTKMRSRLARPWPLILFFLVITCFFATGLSQLQTSVSVPMMFRSDSPIRTQYDWYENNVGPTISGDLLLKFAPMGKDDDPLVRLNLVKLAHLRTLQMDNVGGVLSVVSFVPSVPTRRSLSATATRSGIRSLVGDPDSSIGQSDFISRDAQAEVWRISFRMPQRNETDFTEKIAALQRAVEDELSDSDIPVEVILTGQIAIVQKASQVLLRDLFRSFITAFLFVGVVMMFVLRSVIGGILAMIPNLFPTVAVFGIMGLVRTPLDIGSVMTASVALGIAVDDTVHMLSRYGTRRARGFGQIRASFGALGQCGWAMAQTTAVCGLSLMAYWFSDFVPTSRFALLMFALLFAALFGDVLLLPGMMASHLGKWLSRSVGIDPNAIITADESSRPLDTRRS